MRIVFVFDDAMGSPAQAGYDVDSAAILLGPVHNLAPIRRKGRLMFIGIVRGEADSASSGSELLDPDIQTLTISIGCVGNELPVRRDRWICCQPRVRCDAR